MTKSLTGMPFAKVAEVKEGDYLLPDGDFTCMGGNTPLLVRANGSIPPELYVECAEGQHYLDGQIEGDEYVGLWKVS